MLSFIFFLSSSSSSSSSSYSPFSSISYSSCFPLLSFVFFLHLISVRFLPLSHRNSLFLFVDGNKK